MKARAREKPAVLIIDDDEHYVESLTQLLRSNDYIVDSVTDGSEIDDVLVKTNVQVILLDLSMPGVNGFEVVRQLKDPLGPVRWQINQAAKIIIITGRAEHDTAAFTRKLGADAYLVKPVDPELLLSTLRNVLGASRGRPDRPSKQDGRRSVTRCASVPEPGRPPGASPANR